MSDSPLVLRMSSRAILLCLGHSLIAILTRCVTNSSCYLAIPGLCCLLRHFLVLLLIPLLGKSLTNEVLLLLTLTFITGSQCFLEKICILVEDLHHYLYLGGRSPLVLYLGGGAPLIVVSWWRSSII